MRYLDFDRDALSSMIEAWRADHPRMGLLALVPEAEAGQVPLLQQLCRERGVPVVGAIFPALVEADRFISQGLWLLRLNQMPATFLIADVNHGVDDAATRISTAVESHLVRRRSGAASHVRPTLFLVFDGLLTNIATILDGLYLRLADQVEYAGVNAGSESFRPMPCLFDAERSVGQGVLGLLLDGVAPTVLAHGYPVPERVMTATSTEGNCIQSIDWRLAFEVYREIIGQEYGIDLTRDNFYQYAVHFPVGILRASRDVVVRIPVALNDDGSILCVGEVPENAVLTLLQAPGVQGSQCVNQLVQALRGGPLRDGQHQDLLTFYCAGRRLHLGEAARIELAELQALTGAGVMGGALSLGEIGCIGHRGYPTFHNATLVCTPWQKD